MASAIGLSKRALRRALVRFVYREYLVTTTSNGAADGSTFVAAGYGGSQIDTFKYWYALLDEVNGADPSTAEGEYRAIGEVSASGTFTLLEPFSAQVLDLATLELLPISPALFTEAINQAIVECYPELHQDAEDHSLVVVADQQSYTLPIGITKDLITNMLVEGDTPWTLIPFWSLGNVTFSAAGTAFYLNTTSSMFQAFTAGRKIYIYYQKYLNPLDNDDTYGEVTHDTLADDETGVVLTERRNAWQLLMYYARAILWELLASSPGTQDPAGALAKAAQYRQIAQMNKSRMRMDELAPTFGYL